MESCLVLIKNRTNTGSLILLVFFILFFNNYLKFSVQCDQEKQGIVTSPEKMDEYVRENGFAGWYETSAKENINIDEAARALVNKVSVYIYFY